MNSNTGPGAPDVGAVLESSVVAQSPACASDETIVLENNGVRLDLYRHRGFLDDRELTLTPTEFRMLECLLRAAGRPCSQDALAAAALKVRHDSTDAIVWHIKELRRKLGRPGLIETIYRVGYRLGGERSTPPERSVACD